MGAAASGQAKGEAFGPTRRAAPRARSRSPRRATLAAGACVALALLALVALAARLELRRVEADQRRLVDAQASELDRQLAQLALVPRLLADDPRIVAALASPNVAARAAANRTLERARERGGADFVYLMDASGETVAASNWAEPLSFVGANYGYRPYFRGAIGGAETSFFAVGATTGEPGYFVARPVRGAPIGAGRAAEPVDGPVRGVLAAKFSLDALVDAWRAQPHRSLVTDELGVVILATDASLLYAPGAPLEADARRTLAADRRYAVRGDAGLSLSPSAASMRGAARDGAPASEADVGPARLRGTAQLATARDLATEPWRLHLLVPEARARRRAALAGAGAAGLAAIALLLARTFRQQRRIAAAEGRAARELEGLVAARTRALEAAQRALIAESNFAMLGRMSAAINHEINQPLASLRLDLATLRRLTAREPPPLDEIRRTVLDGDRTTRRIARVIETLRSVARAGTPELVPLDAARLLADVADTVRRERPDASTALDARAARTVDERRVVVRGNAVLLQQAVLNLVHNALDAVQRGGSTVRLTLTTDDASVRVGVEDDGPGVDAGLAERLFEPFATGAASGRGLGLGLTLARQIANDHGGALEHAARPGGGSRFTLALPRPAP